MDALRVRGAVRFFSDSGCVISPKRAERARRVRTPKLSARAIRSGDLLVKAVGSSTQLENERLREPSSAALTADGSSLPFPDGLSARPYFSPYYYIDNRCSPR